MVQKRR